MKRAYSLEEKRRDARKAYHKMRKEKPWLIFYQRIKNRCTNKNADSYSRYGGRGIRNYLTKEDVEYLWKLYKADSLDKPSIDRVDNQYHYILSNCRFIEMKENFRLGKIERWKEENKKWSRLADKCINCGTTKIPHSGHGRCKVCYRKNYWFTNGKRINYERQEERKACC